MHTSATYIVSAQQILAVVISNRNSWGIGKGDII